jgi:cold shock CspA family protein
LIERSYEELEIKKAQNYENRFSPKESRNDEDLDTIIIERPYGSARFYDDQNRSMRLSADSIANGKGFREEWYDLIQDIRAPLSVLFYGFDWENLKELYFDIKERINFVDENSYFFWLAEEFPEEDANEASIMGLKIIQYPFENLLKEIVYLDKEKQKEEVGEGIKISTKNRSTFLDPQTAENYSKYFEIIHDEIEKTSNLEIGPFFQGEEINWKELAANCDVYRSQIKKASLEKRIEKEILSVPSNRGILLLGEYAGSGATTIMKRLGFNIAKKQICPVVYLHRIDANTWKILEDFYQNCSKQKFLILMDNVSLLSEKFRELYGILQSRRVNNVILATARKDEWNQVRISYIESSGADIDESERQKIKLFKWLTLEIIRDRLSEEEKYSILKKYKDFDFLTARATSRFGKGYFDNEIRYSNLLPLCWAATEGKNRKFELIVKEYYDEKLNLSERRIIDVVCAVNLFYSKGITDRILHRIVKINWDRLKLLLNSDSMQQLIMIKTDYYDKKIIYRIVPRNYGISEILLQSQAYDFPQRVLKILTENLSIREGEEVEEDLLFNIIRSKQLHICLADKSLKTELFEFGHNQLPMNSLILQHWGIMLYEHAREQANFGNLDDPAWDESIDKLNHALTIDRYNSAIYHSLGMANMSRGGLFWYNYRRNHLDKHSYNLADIYHQKALKCFHKSLDLNSYDEYAYNTIAKILLKRLSVLKFDNKKIEEFENLMAEVHELLDECGHMVPIDKQVELKATMAYWDRIRGNSPKAKSQYKKILDENPKNHSVSYLLATLLMEEKTIGSLEEAEEVIVKALAEGRRSKGFYKLRYHIAERLYPFDYPKLETILKGLVDIYPEDPYLIFKYAVICFKNENYNLSDQYFRVSDRLRFGDPVKFELHEYMWKQTDNPDKIEQIWDEKYKILLLRIFEGNIQTIDDRKGYVIMDKSGERLHFNPLRIQGDKSFQEGQRVKFNIAFTYIGPSAINLDYV